MGHFRKNEQKKVGHFEKKARDRFENEKRTENEYVRFWGISEKKSYALTSKIPPSNAFWGILRYLPYFTYSGITITSLFIKVNTTCIIGLSHKEVVGLIRQSNEAVRNY